MPTKTTNCHHASITLALHCPTKVSSARPARSHSLSRSLSLARPPLTKDPRGQIICIGGSTQGEDSDSVGLQVKFFSVGCGWTMGPPLPSTMHSLSTGLIGRDTGQFDTRSCPLLRSGCVVVCPACSPLAVTLISVVLLVSDGVRRNRRLQQQHCACIA